MEIQAFKQKIKILAINLHHQRITDAEIEALWEKMRGWGDKIISDIIQNVYDDEKRFPVWNEWKRHYNQIIGYRRAPIEVGDGDSRTPEQIIDDKEYGRVAALVLQRQMNAITGNKNSLAIRAVALRLLKMLYAKDSRDVILARLTNSDGLMKYVAEMNLSHAEVEREIEDWHLQPPAGAARTAQPMDLPF